MAGFSQLPADPQLQQSLVVKQNELTQATSEQTRLFAELRETRKQLEQLDSTYKQEQREHRQRIEINASLTTELEVLRSQLDAAQAQLADHEAVLLEVHRLEVELAIKDGFLSKINDAQPIDRKS